MSETPEKEAAADVKHAAAALNRAARHAWELGLRVELDVFHDTVIKRRHGCPMVQPVVQRVEDL